MGKDKRPQGNRDELKDIIKNIRRKRGFGRDICPNCGNELKNIFSTCASILLNTMVKTY